jgi:hypothetical protein
MNAARLDRSPRLQRVLSVLWQGDWLTTRDLIRRTGACAINSAVAELRQGGYQIETRLEKEDFNSPGVYSYRLIQ